MKALSYAAILLFLLHLSIAGTSVEDDNADDNHRGTAPFLDILVSLQKWLSEDVTRGELVQSARDEAFAALPDEGLRETPTRDEEGPAQDLEPNLRANTEPDLRSPNSGTAKKTELQEAVAQRWFADLLYETTQETSPLSYSYELTESLAVQPTLTPTQMLTGLSNGSSFSYSFSDNGSEPLAVQPTLTPTQILTAVSNKTLGTQSPTTTPTPALTKLESFAPMESPTSLPTELPTPIPTVGEPGTSVTIQITNISILAISETWVRVQLTTNYEGYVYAYAAEDGTIVTISKALSFGMAQRVNSSIDFQIQIEELTPDQQYKGYFYGISSNGTGMSLKDLHETAVNFTTHPMPPSLSFVKFSSSGAYLTIQFDYSTDKGSFYGLDNPVSCQQLFVFEESSSSCEWVSQTIATAYLSSTSSIVPGDKFTLLDDRIKAACVMEEYCEYQSYAKNSSVMVSAPSIPPVPVVSLQYSSTVGRCSDIELDASGSLGGGGRSMTYLWTLISPVNENITHLLSQYGSATSIRVSNSYLDAGTTYSFSLNVTNFFDEMTSAEAVITVSENSVPQITLDAGATLDIARNEEILVFANAAVVECNSTDSGSLSYVWTIERNGTSLGLSSESSDPRYLELDAYSFEADYSYLASVTVSTSSGTSNSESLTITVFKASLSAKIDGGSSRSVQLSDGVVLDASVSTDENNEDGLVSDATFTWICTNGTGNSCGLEEFLVDASILNLTQSQLVASTYMFSLIISDDTRSSNTSVTITVVEDAIPVVSISSSYSSGKVNADGYIALQGEVAVQGMLSATSLWSLDVEGSSSFAWSSVFDDAVLTDLTKSMSSSGVFSHYLVLDGSFLVAGGIYTLFLSASYSGASSESFAEITLTVNEPPTSGYVAVTPQSGYSISDKFNLMATSWTDDVDDFPLFYAFYYIHGTTEILMRGPEYGNSYNDISLVQGTGTNYSLSIVVTVTDQNSGSASSYTVVSVLPYSATVAEAKTAARTLFDSLLQDYNKNEVFTNVQSFVSFLSAVNCSLAPDCAALNRTACALSTVDHTCGACLDRYAGSTVDLTSACVVPGPACGNEVYDSATETDVDCGGKCAPCSIGKVCSNDKDCAHHFCLGGMCAMPPQTCQRNCSGRGTCELWGPNSVLLTEAECTFDNIFCWPVCKCQEGFYGDYCSMDEEDYQSYVSLLGTLVNATTRAIGICDSDSDDIDQISSTFDSLASQFDLLNASDQMLLLNHTGQVITLLKDLDEYRTTASSQLVTVLGVMLDSDVDSDAYGVQTIFDGQDDIGTSIRSSLVAGQTAVSVTTDSLKISTAIYDFSDDGSSGFLRTEVTASEAAVGRSSSAVDLGSSLSGHSEVSVALSEYTTSNPYAQAYSVLNATTLSSVLRLSLSGFVSGSSGRRLADDSLTFTMVLQNYVDQTYYETTYHNLTAHCTSTDFGYKTTLCGNSTVQYECIGFPSVVSISCIDGGRLPRCKLWTGSGWDFDICQVQTYNLTSTTCKCTVDSFARRRLASGSSENYDVSSDANAIKSELASNVVSIEAIFTDVSAVQENYVMFISMGSFLFGVPLLAYLGHFRQQVRQKRKTLPASTEPGKRLTHQKTFIDTPTTNLEKLAQKLDTNTREALWIFEKKWQEKSQWFQILTDQRNVQARIVVLTMLLSSLFTVMFWNATLTPVFNDSSSSTTDTTSSSLASSMVSSIYIAMWSLVIKTPITIILAVFISKTIGVPFPEPPEKMPTTEVKVAPLEIQQTQESKAGCEDISNHPKLLAAARAESVATEFDKEIKGRRRAKANHAFSMTMPVLRGIITDFNSAKVYRDKWDEWNTANSWAAVGTNKDWVTLRRLNTDLEQAKSKNNSKELQKVSKLVQAHLRNAGQLRPPPAQLDNAAQMFACQHNRNSINNNNKLTELLSVQDRTLKSQVHDIGIVEKRPPLHTQHSTLNSPPVERNLEWAIHVNDKDGPACPFDEQKTHMQHRLDLKHDQLQIGFDEEKTNQQKIDFDEEELNQPQLGSDEAKVNHNQTDMLVVTDDTCLVDSMASLCSNHSISSKVHPVQTPDQANAPMESSCETRKSNHHLRWGLSHSIHSDTGRITQFIKKKICHDDNEEMENEIDMRTDKLMEEHRIKESNMEKISSMCVGDWTFLQQEMAYTKMRRRVMMAVELEKRVKMCLAREEEFEADVLILMMAARDCMPTKVAKVRKWHDLAKDEMYGGPMNIKKKKNKDLDTYLDEELYRRAYFRVKMKHYVGWIFISLYCTFCALYLCAFAINYGPSYANQWLISFFTSQAQDIVLIVPLKLALLYIFFPRLYSGKINAKRFRKLESSAVSVQVAERFPNLRSSQLLLDRSNYDENFLKKGHEDLACLFIKKQKGGLPKMKKCCLLVPLLLIQPFLIVIIMSPEDLQEIQLEIMCILGVNFGIVGGAYFCSS